MPATVDIPRLTRSAAKLRERVCKEPDNYALRVELAWCLLAAAVYACGYSTGQAHGSGAEAVPKHGGSRRSADALQRECLHHAATARNLAGDQADREAAERVQTVARALGWEEACRLSEAAVQGRIGQVSSAALWPR